MATNRNFSNMLNEYVTNKMLKTELLKRDYILMNVEKDDSWKGGTIPVPFRGNQATQISFGSLPDHTASQGIHKNKYVRGQITDYVELWGTMAFDQRDLYDHSGRITEDSFLKVLPDQLEDFMDYMKCATSVNLGSGPHFATVTAEASAASGIFTVDKIDRFELGMEVVLDDDNSVPQTCFVTAIDVSNDLVTLTIDATDRFGGAAANLSAYAIANAAKFFHPGSQSTSFTSIRSALLSSANGGSATLHGQTKLAYPHLQAVNIDGSSITPANILDKLFDGYVNVRKRARGNAKTIMCSFGHLGAIMKLIETQKGGFKVTAGQRNASEYGWDEIEIGSIKGSLKVVAIQEWDNDIIAYIDWSAMKFMSNGMFRKRVAPDGKSFYEIRATTGYQYLVDFSLFGEMMYTKPANCGILHSIPSTGF